MGVLFRAMTGFAIAGFALDPAAGTQWLNSAVFDQARAQCAEHKPPCGDGAMAHAITQAFKQRKD